MNSVPCCFAFVVVVIVVVAVAIFGFSVVGVISVGPLGGMRREFKCCFQLCPFSSHCIESMQ